MAYFLRVIITAKIKSMEQREMSALEQKIWNNLKAANEKLYNDNVRPHQTLAFNGENELIVVKAHAHAMCATDQEN